MNNKLRKLHTFNAVMAALHAGQAVAIALLAKSFLLPVTVGYLNYDYATKSLVPATATLFHLSLAWLIVAFLIISSLAHLIIVTVYNKTYNENLAKGINKARWFEYAISASIMMVAISMLVGIYDLGTLIAIFALTTVMNLMGLMTEVHNQSTKTTSWLGFNIGVVAGIVPWIAIAIFFWSANHYGAGQIPTFVYWIYGSIFVCFNCFAVNMILQYKKMGPWRDYLYGERAYVILSLVAKSLLAWQVFAGTLRP